MVTHDYASTVGVLYEVDLLLVLFIIIIFVFLHLSSHS